MSTPGSRLAQPLDYAEQCDLYRLRQCSLHVPATFASEREELAALRAELERELVEVRALTQKDWPLSYAVEPVEELYWRRPLAVTMRKAAEAAEAKARLQREAGEEKARLRRETDEERRLYARQKRDHDRAILAEAHTTLTPAERVEREALRKNWAENGVLHDESETEPIYSATADCGRKHLSLSAACACAIVRRQEAERVTARPTTTTSTTTTSTRPSVSPVASPSVSSVTPTTPRGGLQPATPPPRPRLAPTPTSSSPRPVPAVREQVVPTRREQPVPGPGTRGSAPREQPVPGPPQRAAISPAASSRTPSAPLRLLPVVLPVVAHSPLAGHILTVTRDGNHVSINGIVKALVTAGHGARRQDVYAEIGAMLADGRLVKIHDVIKPARDR